METVSLMGNSDDGGDTSFKKRQWRILPKVLRRFRKSRSTRKDPANKWITSRSNHGDQATVAPSHSTISRQDDSCDSREAKLFHSSARPQNHKDGTLEHATGEDDDGGFEEQLFSFAQLNTEAPSAVYLARTDGLEVILKDGLISDATVYSWSPSPGEKDEVVVPESMLPVEEISFFPEDTHYSTLIDQDQGDDSLFASFGSDIKNNGTQTRNPMTVEDYLDAHLDSSYRVASKTPLTTEQNKPTAAMIKRMSVFTGEDLLTQEADTFAKQFLDQDEKLKSSMPMKQPPPQVRSSESRLLAAFNAFSDTDDDTMSKDRSFPFHPNLFNDHDDEDGTISTVTGSNLFTTRAPSIAETAPHVSSNRYCGLFFSEPLMTGADGVEDDELSDFHSDLHSDLNSDLYSDLYSRFSTAETSSFYYRAHR